MNEVTKTKIIILQTEGDCEGGSIRTIGYFKGTLDQVITYCVKEGITPYYSFSSIEAEIKDVSTINPEISTSLDSYGRIIYKTPEQLEKEVKREEALSKLSDDEIELLGLRRD